MVTIELKDGQTRFRAGGMIHGSARWGLLDPPESMELRLFWFTRGKGTEDIEVIETVRVDSPAAEGSQSFRLRLPVGPYSFSGRLIAVIWAIEAVVKPGGETARVEITLSATGEEVKP
ncbi:MAG: hypothetical protein GY953_21330 [bacterium]|nr:hypothetical protein [bacterium]